MKKTIYLLLLCTVFLGCDSQDPEVPEAVEEPITMAGKVSAIDISAYPQIAATEPVFYDLQGQEKDFLQIAKENGVNTIRLKLWVDPQDGHSGFEEVKAFSEELKSKGFQTWLTVHYSDTWADPGQQRMPRRWEGLAFSVLQDSVAQYTAKVVREIQPDFIQVGNEINSGLLHPQGNINNNSQQFRTLMTTAISAVRENSQTAKIIIHYAGIEGAAWFFNQVGEMDYDIIGISYYPIWHGKSLSDLRNTLQQLGQNHGKDVLLAETAYPFTLEWNDWTNNIVGMESQLILPQFPASPVGQQAFIRQIKKLMVQDISRGLGFCYWGAELIAWKGPEATDASPWENQALFDFENKALPVWKEFGDN